MDNIGPVVTPACDRTPTVAAVPHPPTAQEIANRKQAVLIAKDVLKVIKLKRVNVSQGVYFRFHKGIQNFGEKFKTLFTKIATQKEPCRVCAQGAMFLSHLRLNNLAIKKADTRELYGYGLMGESIHEVCGEPLKDSLAEIFGREQITLIESAFEKRDSRRDNYTAYLKPAPRMPTIPRAIAFGEKYLDARRRLEAIMKNVIDNKGVFVP